MSSRSTASACNCGGAMWLLSGAYLESGSELMFAILL